MNRNAKIYALITALIISTAATTGILLYGANVPGQAALVTIGTVAVLLVAVTLVAYTVRTGRAGASTQQK